MSRAAVVAVLALLAVRSAAAGSGTVKGTVTSVTGPVADAVVMIDGPALRASDRAPHAVVEQRGVRFVPHVVAVPVGTTVDFPNHDPVLHNVFSASPAKKFDLGMYDRGETKSVTFDAPGVVRIGCNAHVNMEAFVVVHTNPYVAVSNGEGSYTVAGVPDGSYELRVWHEQLAERRVPVTIRDGQVQALDVRLENRVP
jgi:plastocyanin